MMLVVSILEQFLKSLFNGSLAHIKSMIKIQSLHKSFRPSCVDSKSVLFAIKALMD